MLEIKKPILALDSGYKQYLFNQVFIKSEIGCEINKSNTDYYKDSILAPLNIYFNKLYEDNKKWSETTYDKLVEKLIVAVNYFFEHMEK